MQVKPLDWGCSTPDVLSEDVVDDRRRHFDAARSTDRSVVFHPIEVGSAGLNAKDVQRGWAVRQRRTRRVRRTISELRMNRLPALGAASARSSG